MERWECHDVNTNTAGWLYILWLISGAPIRFHQVKGTWFSNVIAPRKAGLMVAFRYFTHGLSRSLQHKNSHEELRRR